MKRNRRCKRCLHGLRKLLWGLYRSWYVRWVRYAGVCHLIRLWLLAASYHSLLHVCRRHGRRGAVVVHPFEDVARRSPPVLCARDSGPSCVSYDLSPVARCVLVCSYGKAYLTCRSCSAWVPAGAWVIGVPVVDASVAHSRFATMSFFPFGKFLAVLHSARLRAPCLFRCLGHRPPSNTDRAFDPHSICEVIYGS